MNRERAKELLPIIEHLANGGEVQVKQDPTGLWRTLQDPQFNTDGEYRIKPKPLECWVNCSEDYMCSKFDVHLSPVSAEANRKPHHARLAVHMREVIE